MNDFNYYPPNQNDNKKRNALIVIAVILVFAILVCIGTILLYIGEDYGSAVSKEASIGDYNTKAESKEPATHSEPSDEASKSQETISNNGIDLRTGDGTEILDIKETVAKAKASFVRINCVVRNGYSQGSSSGSGSVLTEDGYIVTCYHVIESATSITVTLPDETTLTATVVGGDETTDIAVLKVDATGLTPATIGSSADMQCGDSVIAIGNPNGTKGGVVTYGIVSAAQQTLTLDGEEIYLLQTDATVIAGFSGGGLYNQSGELIGIIRAKTGNETNTGIGYAIPTDFASTIITDLVECGYVRGRVSLGATAVDITSMITAYRNGLTELGTYISEVTSGSDAETAGLKVRDLIVRINGTDITSAEQVTEIISKLSIGDKAVFEIRRDGTDMLVTVTLTEYRPQN